MTDYMEDWVQVCTPAVWDYDWQRMEVYYSPSVRRYFWNEQSGCSCNSWEDPESIEEWQNGDRKAALRAVEGFTVYNDYEYTLDDRLRDKAAVRDFQESLDADVDEW